MQPSENLKSSASSVDRMRASVSLWAGAVRDGFALFTGHGGTGEREGSPWTGLGAVVMREFSDNLSSVRMRLLQALVFVAGFAAAYSAIGEIKNVVGEDPFVFLKVFTVAKEPLPSFLAFLSFLIPIVAITLGFDAINGEFNRRTMSRILAQPIYRDALLVGKFLAGLATLGVFLVALWLFMMGLGILLIGLPPGFEEILRGVMFLLAAVAYGGVWLAIAMMFSIIFRSTATSALASLSLWLLFAVFWPMIAPMIAGIVSPIDAFDPRSQIAFVGTQEAINRLSPNTLFGEASIALLSPSTRSLSLVDTFILSRTPGALLGAPLPLSQSLLLIWPQLTSLIALVLLLFTAAYVAFQRQEVRA
jgi:ABC-2 type transport system permease protein